MFYGLSSPSVTSLILLLDQVQQGRGQPLQHGGGGRGLHLGREVGIGGGDVQYNALRVTRVQ